MQILATLRDSRERDRKDALRLMCKAWGVDRRHKIDGKWKDRNTSAVDAELTEAVCFAAAQWKPGPPGRAQRMAVQTTRAQRLRSTMLPRTAKGFCSEVLQYTRRPAPVPWLHLWKKGGADSAPQRAHAQHGASPYEARPAKKGRTRTADPMRSAVSSGLSRTGPEPRVLQLPITSEDVISLRRLVPDLFEATTRSGELWRGDAQLLETLPQGSAKLGTLEVREETSTPKAKATQERKTPDATSAGGKSTEQPEKKLRTLEDKSDRESMGAAESDERMAVAAAAAQEEPDREAVAEGLPP